MSLGRQPAAGCCWCGAGLRRRCRGRPRRRPSRTGPAYPAHLAALRDHARRRRPAGGTLGAGRRRATKTSAIGAAADPRVDRPRLAGAAAAHRRRRAHPEAHRSSRPAAADACAPSGTASTWASARWPRAGRRSPGRCRPSARRVGLNNLRFTASAAREGDRQLSFRLERLELEPAGPGCGPVETATRRRRLHPRPRSGAPDAAAAAAAGRAGARARRRARRRGRAVPEPRRHDRSGRFELDHHRRPPGRAAGDRRSAVDRDRRRVARTGHDHGCGCSDVSGDERPAAWRAACGLLWKEPLAAAGLLVLLALAVAVGRRWPGSRSPLWLDCVLLMGLALALRLAYLHAYPELDPGRFGDSWEYLRRSRYLIRGDAVLERHLVACLAELDPAAGLLPVPGRHPRSARRRARHAGQDPGRAAGRPPRWPAI